MMDLKPFDQSFKPPAGLPRRQESEHGQILGINGRNNALLNMYIKGRLEKAHLLDPDLYRRQNPPEDETSRRRQKEAYDLLEPVLREEMMITPVNAALGKEAVMNVMWSKAFISARRDPRDRITPLGQAKNIDSLGFPGADVPSSLTADMEDNEKPAGCPVSTQQSKLTPNPDLDMPVSTVPDVRTLTTTFADVSLSAQADDKESRQDACPE